MSEQYVTLAEVKELLTAEAEARGEEMLASQRAALDHAQKVQPLSLDQAKALIEEVSQFEEISDAVAVKIADILPKYKSDVRAILSKERIVADDDFYQQIIDIVAKYI